MPEIPMPWLTPSNPADMVARGYEIGARVGAQQAAQRFQQMQMIRQQQADAMQEARWQAQFGLQAAEAARKHEAQMQYQKAIESGTDPLDALIRFGPSMGSQASAEAAAIRAMYQKEKKIPTWSLQEFDGRKVLMSDQGEVKMFPTGPREAATWEEVEGQDAQGNPIKLQRNTETGKVESFPGQSRAADFTERMYLFDMLNEAQRDARDLTKAIAEEESGGLYLNAMNKKARGDKLSPTDLRAIESFNAKVSDRDAIKARIQQIGDEIRGISRTSNALPPGSPKLKILSIRRVTPTEAVDSETDTETDVED